MTAPENTRERLAEAPCPSCGHLVQWHHVSGGLPCACWPGGGEDRCSCRLTFADALLPLIDTLLREQREGIAAAIAAFEEAATAARTFGGER